MPLDLHHRFDGPPDAPVLVMGSSLGSTTEMWEPQLGLLSRRLRLLRFDLPGHGESPPPEGAFSVADLAAAIVSLLDRLELETVSYCGLSVGGMAGMALAVNAPDRVERLALCCTAANLPPPEMWMERAATVREQGVEVVADSTMERWFTEPFRRREPQTVARFREILTSTPREAYAAGCQAVGGFDLSDSLRSVAAPTLVLVGSEDPNATLERGEELRDGIPESRLTVIDAAAHMANVEQPQAVGEALAKQFEVAT
jgi:3-oxoadipate enol-lactonase